MANIAIRYPKSTLESLATVMIPVDFHKNGELVAIITTSSHGLNMRGFGAFLSIFDRIYGRASRAGIFSYSQSPQRQLKITEIRSGSVEIVIAQAIHHLVDSIPLILAVYFVKYLALGIKGASDVSKNMAESYKVFHEGKLAKTTQKKMQDEMERDEFLRNLSAKERKELAKLLSQLANFDRRLLPAAERFAKQSLKDASIRARTKRK